jgi:hypothetical protein
MALTLTIGGVDYTDYLVPTIIPELDDTLNRSKEFTFAVYPANSEFLIVTEGQRVRLFSDTKVVFTGYVVRTPVREIVATGYSGYNVWAESDETKFDSEPIGASADFIGQYAGEILEELVGLAGGTGIDFSGVAKGPFIPKFVLDSSWTFSDAAFDLCQKIRWRWYILDSKFYFIAQNDKPYGYDIDNSVAEFNTPGYTITQSNVKIANDVTAIGFEEPTTLVRDYFVGNGKLNNFALSASIFGDLQPNTLFYDSLTAGALNTIHWQVLDPFNAISYERKNFTIAGTAHPLGTTLAYVKNSFEMGGELDFSLGTFQFADLSVGILSGLYSDRKFTQDSCFAGIWATGNTVHTGLQAIVSGQRIGNTITTQPGHTYELRVHVSADEYYRASQIFISTTGQYGGDITPCGAYVTIEVLDNNPSDPIANTTTTTLFDDRVENLPAFGLLGVFNSMGMFASMVKGPIVRSFIPVRVRTTQYIKDFSLSVDNGNWSVSLKNTITNNTPLTVAYRDVGTPQARVANSNTIATDGHKYLTITTSDEVRNSKDCENLALSYLNDHQKPLYEGIYTTPEITLTNIPQSGRYVRVVDLTHGEFVAVVRDLKLSFVDLEDERVTLYTVYGFAPILPTYSTLNQTGTIPAINFYLIPITITDDFNLVASSITGSVINIDTGRLPRGGWEIRTSDEHWGDSNASNLVFYSYTQTFILTRTSRTNRFYVREFDTRDTTPNSLPFTWADSSGNTGTTDTDFDLSPQDIITQSTSRYSRNATLIVASGYPLLPAQPKTSSSITVADTVTFQIDFDTTEVTGFEINLQPHSYLFPSNISWPPEDMTVDVSSPNNSLWFNVNTVGQIELGTGVEIWSSKNTFNVADDIYNSVLIKEWSTTSSSAFLSLGLASTNTYNDGYIVVFNNNIADSLNPWFLLKRLNNSFAVTQQVPSGILAGDVLKLVASVTGAHQTTLTIYKNELLICTYVDNAAIATDGHVILSYSNGGDGTNKIGSLSFGYVNPIQQGVILSEAYPNEQERISDSLTREITDNVLRFYDCNFLTINHRGELSTPRVVSGSLTRPLPPVLTIASVIGRSVSLTVSSENRVDIVEQVVEVASDSAFSTIVVTDQKLGETTVSSFNTLEFGTFYARGRKRDSLGWGNYTVSPVIFTCDSAQETPAAPTSAPTLTQSVRVGGDGTVIARVTADWTDSTDINHAHYYARIRVVGATNWTVYVADTSIFVFEPLSTATAYEVQYSDVGTTGFSSAFSPSSTITTDGAVTPSLPADLAVHGGFRMETLTWTAGAEKNIAYYVVYFSTDNITFNPISKTYTTSYIDSGDQSRGLLGINTTYYYKIAAVNTDGVESTITTSVSATTKPVSTVDIVGGSIDADVLQANTITAAKILTGTLTAAQLSAGCIATSDYTESGNPDDPITGASSYPTGGACLRTSAAVGVPGIRTVGGRGIQIGQYKFTDYFFRIFQGIDGANTGLILWRGNNDTSTSGGAPNIGVIDLQVSISNSSAIVPYVVIGTPTGLTDNLDSMTYAELELYSSVGNSVINGKTYGTLPSRGYYDKTTHTAANNRIVATVNYAQGGGGISGQYATAITPAGSAGVLHARMRVWNIYGPSDWMWYAAPAAYDTNFTRQSTAPSLGTGSPPSSGGGGGTGGSGGGCPAPWVSITLASGVIVSANDLYNGAKIIGVDDSSLQPKVGEISFLQKIWAHRYEVLIEDGRAPQFSKDHQLNVVNKGWTRVQDIKTGDLLVGLTETRVRTVKYIGMGEVISFQVIYCGTYFTDGILSHNNKSPVD